MFYLHFSSFTLHGCLDFNLKPSVDIIGRDVRLASVANVALACVLIVEKKPKNPKEHQRCHLHFFIQRRKIQNFKQKCGVGQN